MVVVMDGKEVLGRFPVDELVFSARATAMLKKSEGLFLKAYPDPASGGAPWTIGFGHTAGVTPGMKISVHQAEKFLAEDVARAERVVRGAVKVPLAQGEFDALVDFVFNVGPGKKGVKDGLVELKRGGPSTLLRKVNAGDYAGAALEFRKWIFGSGKVMGGLVTRAAERRAMFEGAYA